MNIETEVRRSRRSDRRHPETSDGPSAVATGTRGPGGLGWPAFTTAFPGRRRHDLEALSAYSRYAHSRDAGTDSSAEPAGVETGQAASGATVLRDWEAEGAATLSPHGS